MTTELLREQLREVATAEINEHWERAVVAPMQVVSLLAKAFEFSWGRDEFRSRVILEFQRRMQDDGCVPADSPGIERESCLARSAAFDEHLATRLIMEARADSGLIRSDSPSNMHEVSDAKFRIKNNLPKLADQLECAMKYAEVCRRMLAREHDKLPEYAAIMEQLTKERDAARRDCDSARAELCLTGWDWDTYPMGEDDIAAIDRVRQ